MSIRRAWLRNTSNALMRRIKLIRLRVPPKLFGVNSWISQMIRQWISDCWFGDRKCRSAVHSLPLTCLRSCSIYLELLVHLAELIVCNRSKAVCVCVRVCLTVETCSPACTDLLMNSDHKPATTLVCHLANWIYTPCMFCMLIVTTYGMLVLLSYRRRLT